MRRTAILPAEVPNQLSPAQSCCPRQFFKADQSLAFLVDQVSSPRHILLTVVALAFSPPSKVVSKLQNSSRGQCFGKQTTVSAAIVQFMPELSTNPLEAGGGNLEITTKCAVRLQAAFFGNDRIDEFGTHQDMQSARRTAAEQPPVVGTCRNVAQLSCFETRAGSFAGAFVMKDAIQRLVMVYEQVLAHAATIDVAFREIGIVLEPDVLPAKGR